MLGATPGGWLGAVVGQPALCTVPVAFLTMCVVSLMTQHRLPAHLESTMVRLHAPEALDLDRGGFVPVAERAG
jgi:Na+(H+)/acetate symporter ActP